MSNLTLSIDDDLLRRARLRAIREGTSVNGVVRDHLLRYADEPTAAEALRDVLELAEKSTAGSNGDGRGWRRDDIYAGRVEA